MTQGKMDLAHWFHQLVNEAQEITGEMPAPLCVSNEFIQKISQSPQLTLDLCKAVEQASIHQANVKIGFYEAAKPKQRRQVSHTEPCDIFENGRTLVKKLDSLFDIGKRHVQTLQETEADQKELDMLARNVGFFIDSTKLKNFVVRFDPAKPQDAKQKILQNFNGYATRKFFLEFLRENDVILEDASVQIASADEVLAEEAREMYLRPGQNGAPAIIWAGIQPPSPLHPN